MASAAGVSAAAPSYALRGSSKIPADTAHRVRAAAETLGYRPNGRVAELMAHIRRGQSRFHGDYLALVWPQSRVAFPDRGSLARRIGVAGTARAEQLGYRPEEFWPWERFALAITGSAEWTALPPRAAHQHYEGMRSGLIRSAGGVEKRWAAIVDAASNERCRRGWEAAWRIFAPEGARERFLTLAGDDPAERLTTWLRQERPDLLFIGGSGVQAAAARAGWTPRDGRMICAELGLGCIGGVAGHKPGLRRDRHSCRGPGRHPTGR